MFNICVNLISVLQKLIISFNMNLTIKHIQATCDIASYTSNPITPGVGLCFPWCGTAALDSPSLPWLLLLVLLTTVSWFLSESTTTNKNKQWHYNATIKTWLQFYDSGQHIYTCYKSWHAYGNSRTKRQRPCFRIARGNVNACVITNNFHTQLYQELGR